MESRKLNVSKPAGIIIAVCAIGIMIVKFLTNGEIDSYIMPFILLCISVIVFSAKPNAESKRLEFSKKQSKVLLSIASIILISGIVMFFTTVI